MHDIRTLLLVIAPGVQTIYQLGYEPTEEKFTPFSEDMMEKYIKKHGVPQEKMYFLGYTQTSPSSAEVLTVTESDKRALLAGAAHLKVMFKSHFPEHAANPNGIPYEQKLELLTSILPPVLYESSRFGKSQQQK
jgi:hypothetical protein